VVAAAALSHHPPRPEADPLGASVAALPLARAGTRTATTRRRRRRRRRRKMRRRGRRRRRRRRRMKTGMQK
jgi:hypothetical protein